MSDPPPAPSRVAAIDWLRGLAVVLMIQAHGFDSWLAPEAKTGEAYWFIRHMSGLPSRLFLLLVGVAAAIRFEAQLAKGLDTGTMRWQTAKRGLQIIALAYLFRLQELVLSGFKGGWPMLLKVDILNAIGFSLLVVAAVATPRRGRLPIAETLLVAAVLLAFGPIVGLNYFPEWMPRMLTSYIGGQRPMSWFPLFPWGAWTLVGVAVGHLWVRQSRTPRGEARIFLLTALAGVASTGTVIAIRAVNPYVILYPTELAQQMGPGSFFYRLGIIGVLAGIGWVVTRLSRGRFSPFIQLGRTSLLIYWIHVDLCYGGISRPLRSKLGIPEATVWILALVVLMLGVSLLKTRYAPRVKRWFAQRRERPSPGQKAPVSAGGLGR